MNQKWYGPLKVLLFCFLRGEIFSRDGSLGGFFLCYGIKE
jgi:hypothetical protein